MATATANHHQRQINLRKLQSQSLDLQQIPNPKTSTKKKIKKKRKRNSKSSTNTADPLQPQTSPAQNSTNHCHNHDTTTGPKSQPNRSINDPKPTHRNPLQPQTPLPSTATNIAGPKLNQPPPQPPAQNPNPTDQSMTQNPHIETHPKYHTHEPIKRSKG